jgi:hypothetical protein
MRVSRVAGRGVIPMPRGRPEVGTLPGVSGRNGRPGCPAPSSVLPTRSPVPGAGACATDSGLRWESHQPVVKPRNIASEITASPTRSIFRGSGGPGGIDGAIPYPAIRPVSSLVGKARPCQRRNSD